MSKNTVKASLTRARAKRAKRTVENPDFGAFVSRILRAYGRRVAAGDVEALRLLVAVPAEAEAMVRISVAGLRKAGYSWQDIADRLGTSKQAAHMRYGRDEQGPRSSAVDRRVLDAGMSVTVATLVEVFADHYPGSPAVSACPSCGFRYPDKVTDCPTNATVRPMLARRRREDWDAFNRLTGDQQENLIGTQAKRVARQHKRVEGAAQRPVTESLFATTDLTRRESLR
jgi:hypothetical protein